MIISKVLETFIFSYHKQIHCQKWTLTRGIFVMECAGMPFWQKRFSEGHKPERRHGIHFTRLGMSCYSTALLSNKLAYFVQFLKEKLTPPPSG
jgi:hypothetical protein